MSQEQPQAGGCLFCKIASGEIPSKKVYEDSSIFAFLDINPRNPGHTLVIPKKHYTTMLEMPPKEFGRVMESARVLGEAVMKGTNAEGLAVLQSNGKAAGQVVAHMHVHLIPRFISEGPVSLEGILQVKKMPEEMQDKIADSIKSKMGASGGSQEPKFDF